jgi:ribosomal protein L37E
MVRYAQEHIAAPGIAAKGEPMQADEDEIDDGPLEEDIARLSHDTAYCPRCGAEVWDQAEVCPACGEYLGGNTSTRPPLMAEWRAKWVILIILAVLIAFVLIYVL